MKPSPRPQITPSTVACLCTFLIAACLLGLGVSSAEPRIALSKKSGPPTSRILVSGRGFEPNAGVDIYFDTKDEVLAITDGKGGFNDAKAYAPRSARPGQHWVTALERNNDKGAQKRFLVRTNWSQFHFTPAHDGLNAYENVLNPDSAGDLQLKWSFKTGGDVSPPVVVNGVVYIGSGDDYVYALKAGSGVLLWKYRAQNGIFSSLAVAEGMVYVVAYDDDLYALDAATGTKVWSFPTGLRYLGVDPVVANGTVYVSSWNGSRGAINALDARTGAKRWSYGGHNAGFHAPAVAEGVVYTGSSDGNVYALDARNGAKLWSYHVGPYGPASTPAVANGIVYIDVDFDATESVYALNARTGTLLWRFPTPNPVFSAPTVANGVVYFGGTDFSVYALDAYTGTKIWSYRTGESVYSSPVVADGVVYVGSDDYNVYALDARKGTLLWEYVTGYWVNSSPAVANGVLYVGSGDGNVYAFSAQHAAGEVGAASTRPDLKALRPDFTLKADR